MRFTAILLFCMLIASCRKEEYEYFTDSDILLYQDFKTDPATGDTIYTFYIPSGFTPNGDGKNDLWQCYGDGFMENSFKVTVFDHDGHMLFQATDIYKAWSGKIPGKGIIAPVGLYNAKVEVQDSTGAPHVYFPSILLNK
jgi:gliding motility-associated-like protein